jgi:hypothetical protein
MILFRSNNYEIDLTLFGVDLNEESNMFMDNMIKSYAIPFNIPISPEVAQAFGFPNTDNITSFTSSIKGQIIIDDDYYAATLVSGDSKGDNIEVTLYYGEEELPVYGTKLSALPWPLHIVTSSSALAAKHLNATWPAVTHNFPMVYRPKIRQENDYAAFERFVNNYTGSDFIQNQEIEVESEPVYENRNVLSPCVYLLEILSFGFKQEGKKIRGNVVQDARLKNLLYIPKNYIEKFSSSVFSNFQFDFPDSTSSITIDYLGGLNAGIFVETINTGIYIRSFTPDNIGNYTLKFNLNLDPATAKYFDLGVYREHPISGNKTYLYSSKSNNNRVSISEDLEIEVDITTQFHPIRIEMKLAYTSASIAPMNSFEYSFRQGRLNELIGPYSLSEFMPDMTFGEYVNRLKNWLNLDIKFIDEYVYIDFVQDIIGSLTNLDHRHLEMYQPIKRGNNNRVFRLEYSDGSVAITDRTGQIFSDIEKDRADIIEIKMEVEMAVVERNYDFTTAIYPEDDKMVFALYPGLTGGQNRCLDKIDDFTGKVDNVNALYWSKWLSIRTNNFTFIERYTAHQSEVIQTRSRLAKYNQILLPKTIRKKRRYDEYWEIEQESETIQ